MKKIILLLIIFCLNGCERNSIEQEEILYEIYGRVIDTDTYSPIEGVVVNLDGLLDSTNYNGEFSLESSTGGTHLISFSHQYYDELSQSISVPVDSSLEISLSINIVELVSFKTEAQHFNYSYSSNTGSPRPSSVQKSGKAKWTMYEEVRLNDTIKYLFRESRIDSVTRTESMGGTFMYRDTVNNEFIITLDSNKNIYFNKSPFSFKFSNLARADFGEFQGVYNNNSYLEIKRELGITRLHISTQSGDSYYAETYQRIE